MLQNIQFYKSQTVGYIEETRQNNKKKPGSYLLSRRKGSIIGVRELDFRVRNGNGYYLSTMATGQINKGRKLERVVYLRATFRLLEDIEE